MSRMLYENRPGFYLGDGNDIEKFDRWINRFFEFKWGAMRHRSPLKCTVNPVLRFIQFWTNKPYVISSVCGKCPVNGYYFIKYRFMRVELLK